jgi:anhydro-N-acetylmuramic acid kinase
MVEGLKNRETKIIGLMSGTSLDGVDIVYVKFLEKNDSYTFSILASETISYSDEWEVKLKTAFNADKDALENLDMRYGEYLGKLVVSFMNKYQIEKVDFVASHGHTIFHKPEEGYTLQIGNGASISNKCKQKVICDFRSQDVAYGGQGAPLVPIGDALLFSEYEYCLNLGGFANVSFNKNGIREAFDICPVNIVMNHYSKQLGFDYDNKGIIASKGEVSVELLKQLNNLPFYLETGPKSLGYEFVVATVFPIIDSFDFSVATILRTFIEHIVIQISNKIRGRGKLLITGGGVFNTFLIGQLQKSLSVEVVIPDSKLVDFKEALIFAFLGLLRNNGVINCLKSVTGASKDHSGGVIFEYADD